MKWLQKFLYDRQQFLVKKLHNGNPVTRNQSFVDLITEYIAAGALGAEYRAARFACHVSFVCCSTFGAEIAGWAGVAGRALHIFGD
jgi:hypothetical protein